MGKRQGDASPARSSGPCTFPAPITHVGFFRRIGIACSLSYNVSSYTPPRRIGFTTRSAYCGHSSNAGSSYTAIISRGEVLLAGEPREAMRSLDGRVWRRTVPKGDLARYQQDYTVLSTRLVAGQPVIHIFAPQSPGAGFEAVAPDLEDVYFQRLRLHAKAA